MNKKGKQELVHFLSFKLPQKKFAKEFGSSCDFPYRLESLLYLILCYLFSMYGDGGGCVYVRVHGAVHVCMRMWLWRSEVDVGFLLSILLFLRSSLPLKPELIDLDRLSDP